MVKVEKCSQISERAWTEVRNLRCHLQGNCRYPPSNIQSALLYLHHDSWLCGRPLYLWKMESNQRSNCNVPSESKSTRICGFTAQE